MRFVVRRLAFFLATLWAGLGAIIYLAQAKQTVANPSE